jgi:hypothetical protein
MMNNNLINQATKLVMEYAEANHITVSEAAVRKQVESWYINTDAATPYIIAASVMEYGSYDDQPVDYDMMRQAEHCYFPNYADETLYHVSEYEASLRDAMWR